MAMKAMDQKARGGGREGARGGRGGGGRGGGGGGEGEGGQGGGEGEGEGWRKKKKRESGGVGEETNAKNKNKYIHTFFVLLRPPPPTSQLKYTLGPRTQQTDLSILTYYGILYYTLNAITSTLDSSHLIPT